MLLMVSLTMTGGSGGGAGGPASGVGGGAVGGRGACAWRAVGATTVPASGRTGARPLRSRSLCGARRHAKEAQASTATNASGALLNRRLLRATPACWAAAAVDRADT